MGALKEKPVVKSVKQSTLSGASLKGATVVSKTRNFDALTPEQEALYVDISSNKGNNLSAAAARAAKHANRK